MKKTLLTLTNVLFCAITFAQSVPQGINYQAVARDASGDVLMNQALTIQFSVISDITTSAISWQETHNATTNDYGLFTAIIGQGSSTSIGAFTTFDVIDWGSSNHLLKVEIDYGAGYVNMGTTALMSVPYALQAGNTETLPSGTSNQTLRHDGNNWVVSNTLLNDGNKIMVGGSGNSKLSIFDTYGSLYGGINLTNSVDDWYIFQDVDYGIRFRDDAYDRFIIDNAGNVGLGNMSPGYKLDVSGDINFTGNLYQNGSLFTCLPLQNTIDSLTVAVLDLDSIVSQLTSQLQMISFGCTNQIACNYDSTAAFDDGSCVLPDGCTDPIACNYDASATCDDGSCIGIPGCTDPLYLEYDLSASCDDGSCLTLIVNGCTDALACNYDPLANTDDGSCNPAGCTDSLACNYDSTATCDDGSCIGIPGCTDSTAPNYNSLATCDDGSCIGIGSTFQGGIVFYLDGNGGGLIAAPSDQGWIKWGCYGTITGAHGTAIGTGAQNTIDILAAVCNNPWPIAAETCANLTLGGYSDWFLPSIDELHLMWVNRIAIGLFGNGYGTFSGYWSSTEYDNPLNTSYSYVSAIYLQVDSGNTSPYSKPDSRYVRAIRAF